MNGILIEPKDQEEMQFMHELLDKIGIKHSALDIEELEDLALGMMMLEDDASGASEFVSEEEVLKLLRS